MLEKLISLKNKFFSFNNTKEDSNLTTHNTEKIINQNIIEKDTTEKENNTITVVEFNEKTSRNSYTLQIGLDFGTSSCKCIYRDIDVEYAWVYKPNMYSDLPFLFSSVSIFKNNLLKLHKDCNIQYPENGLFYLKFALENIAKGNFSDKSLESYKKALNTNNNDRLAEFVKTVGIFFLAKNIFHIKKYIKSQFNDFGELDDDSMYINLGISSSGIKNQDVKDLYLDILNKAWLISEDYDLSREEYSLDQINKMVFELQCKISDFKNNEICNIYLEVSANMQSFIKAGGDSNSPSSTYIFSDTGAGTVDQCIFTYVNDTFQYFSAQVVACGSSYIEMNAATLDPNHTLEFWRSKKEENSTDKTMINAKEEVAKTLKIHVYNYTLIDWKKRLFTNYGVDKESSITPISSMRDNHIFIFGGGGHTENPYKKAVLEAFKIFCNIKNDETIRSTGIAVPEDLDLPIDKKNDWIKRLYVAYGLSFLYINLADNEYVDPISEDDKVKNDELDCVCKGKNPNCYYCQGTGVTNR